MLGPCTGSVEVREPLFSSPDGTRERKRGPATRTYPMLGPSIGSGEVRGPHLRYSLAVVQMEGTPMRLQHQACTVIRNAKSYPKGTKITSGLATFRSRTPRCPQTKQSQQPQQNRVHTISPSTVQRYCKEVEYNVLTYHTS